MTPSTYLSGEQRLYAGPERRRAPRIPANFPVRFQRRSPSGGEYERYAQTKNVSSDGVLLESMEMFEQGTEVDVSIGIPFTSAASLPTAQLNGVAVVVRSESASPCESDGFAASIALKFVTRPTVSTELSMFD